MMMLITSLASIGFTLVSCAFAAITTTTSTLLPLCTTQSQPNPIAAQYPDLPTGTVNGTIAVLPITYTLARSIIPAQYGILVKEYKKWLPNLPNNLYPAILQTELDHGVQASGFTIPDFSRAGIIFPFVDALSDNSTPFAYGNSQLISAANVVAISGAEAYGYQVTPATFDPPCDGYTFKKGGHGATYFNAYANVDQTLGKPPSIATLFNKLGAGQTNPYSIAFWKNVTNQPQFSNTPGLCDNFIRLFNSSVSTGKYAPVPVFGTVTALPPVLGPSVPAKTWTGVYGLNVDNAFIEHNLVTCQSLQGYHGTGSGD